MTKALAMIILDGFGYRAEEKGNAVRLAHTPYFDELWQTYPHTFLDASGEAVGLPQGQMGNSEVGHTTIGAGRVIDQSLLRIQKAIASGELQKHPRLQAMFQQVKSRQSTLHLVGLLSDGGVHSHIDHLFAVLDAAKQAGLKKIAIHVFTDGRDVSPDSAPDFLKALQDHLDRLGVGKIASISGRYYAMDRDRRYERTQKAYDAIVHGRGPSIDNLFDYIQKSYDQGITDEFFLPAVLGSGQAFQEGDGVFAFNFRPDRMRQLIYALADPDFDGFDSSQQASNVDVLSMMPYDSRMDLPVLFEQIDIIGTYGEVLSQHGISQIRLAETEKYPHVTYFMNGSREEPFPLEDRLLVPSPKVPTYDLQPEMSAFELTDAIIEDLQAGRHQAYIINYANPDMVGHTGDLEATIRAVEAVDQNLGRLMTALQAQQGTALIFADHGNAELMVTDEGEPHTAHTNHPVPAILTQRGLTLREGGGLRDVAPTLLELLGIPKAPEMTGQSLISKGE